MLWHFNPLKQIPKSKDQIQHFELFALDF